jgi:DNA mismatch repair protein MutS2
VNPKDLSTLEFPKILERLARYAAFAPGKELVVALAPSDLPAEARRRQIETAEARWLLSVKPDLGLGGARDMRAALQQALLSATLTPHDLLDIRQTLIAARDLKRAVIGLTERVPHLADIAYRIEDCPGLIQEIGRCISERGEVVDAASPNLSRLRREVEVALQRLMDRLQHIVQSADNSQYLQDAFITQRHGRYVIPLRAEFKGRIRGIVHDQSASGATLFIEPLATVELNNRWRQAQLEEEEEVQRILLALSQRVADEAERIRWTLAALAELDLALAKARYADELRASEAHWVIEEGSDSRTVPLQLLAARHPLLDPGTVVPIDVCLAADTSILIITGPNTGGKTVALKTIGLLVAMAQAGLHLPASEGSLLPFFGSIYADIGDEQSTEQSLSTFSAHLTNIVRILNSCQRDSLVILDELGAGTDPVEGSALARAVLTHLRERGVTTFVATHYSELKSYAHQTPGVTNASVEFDAETLAPTYRLRIGLPGRSNAFAIARRLGLADAVVEAAQALVSPDAQHAEAMLHDIQAALDAAREERAAVETIRVQLETRRVELEQRLARLDRERRDILNTARAEARRDVEQVRRELAQLRAQWPARPPWAMRDEAVPETAALEQAATALDALDARLADEAATPPPAPIYRGPLRAGDIAWVIPLHALGEVIESQRGRVEVQVGRFRTTVRRNQVELRERPVAASKPSDTGGRTAAVRVAEAESPGMELDLRGRTTDEGLIHLERYLDTAYRANLPWVRIIHGKGTGVMRAAVREALRDHALVASYRAGDEGEGGEGVTVASLAVG